MDERIKAFLDKKKREIEMKKEKQKEETLISLGLYEKVYSPDGQCTNEYSFSEWDENGGKFRYYKKVPFNSSDEEFEEIKKVCKIETAKPATRGNSVATLLSVIAWIIYICGFIIGIGIFGRNSNEKGAFLSMLLYWFVALISGTIMLFLSELIKIFNDIKNKR